MGRGPFPDSDRRHPRATGYAIPEESLWMMRQGWDYEQVKKFGSHAGQPGHRDGVKYNTE